MIVDNKIFLSDWSLIDPIVYKSLINYKLSTIGEVSQLYFFGVKDVINVTYCSLSKTLCKLKLLPY